MVLTVGDVHEAIAAARPADEALVFRDRRISWLELTERPRRLANAPPRCRARVPHRANGARGLGVRSGPPGHLPPQRQRVPRGDARGGQGPRGAVNVNYRYVADELRYVLDDAEHAAVVYHGRSPRRWPRCSRSPAPAAPAPGATTAAAPLLPGARWYEEALASARRRDRRWGSRPTTSTSSTPVARRGCRRASSGARPTSSPPASGGRAPRTIWSRRPRRRPDLPGAAGPTVHARGRPLERHQHVDRRRHRGHPGSTPFGSTRSTSSTPSRRSGWLPPHRWRRLRPPLRRRATGPAPSSTSALPPHRRRRPLRHLKAQLLGSLPHSGSWTCWARRRPAARASRHRRAPAPRRASSGPSPTAR